MHKNLVPVTRVDVTGKSVIRHMRPDADAPKIAPRFPMPEVAENRQQQTEGTVNHLFLSLGRKTNDVPIYLVDAVKEMSHREISSIKEALVAVDDEENLSVRQQHILSLISCYKSGSDFSSTLVASQILRRGSSLDLSCHTSLLNLLGGYDELKESVDDLASASPQMQRRICDIASAFHDLESAQSVKSGDPSDIAPLLWYRAGTIYLRDQKVLDALVKHPDHINDIVQLVFERGNVDALDEVLSAANSIRDGAL